MPSVDPSALETGEIDILLLGPVCIRGAERPFARAWCLELLAYLALHPDGVTTEAWTTALWPDGSPSPSTIHSTASATRRSLGTSSSGEDHLPRSRGSLSLGKHITNDWARFQALAQSESVEDWEAALSLIRGRPFEGLRSSATDWVVLEGFAAEIEGLTVDVAVRFAEAQLPVGNHAAVERLTRRALLVSRYDERLYRILLRSAHAAGNRAGIEATINELISLVADDVAPWDSIHEETIRLYRSLTKKEGSRLGA